MKNKKQLKFYESDWGSNLPNKKHLTFDTGEHFKNKDVEYADMKINSVYSPEGHLYQTLIIAYYE